MPHLEVPKALYVTHINDGTVYAMPYAGGPLKQRDAS